MIFNEKISTFDESMKLKPKPEKWSNFKFPENGHRGQFCQTTFQNKLT